MIAISTGTELIGWEHDDNFFLGFSQVWMKLFWFFIIEKNSNFESKKRWSALFGNFFLFLTNSCTYILINQNRVNIWLYWRSYQRKNQILNKNEEKKKCPDQGSNLGPPAWQHEMLDNDLLSTTIIFSKKLWCYWSRPSLWPAMPT